METRRANMAQERQTRLRDQGTIAVQNRVADETHRSNLANELIKTEANRISSIDAATRQFSASETQRSNLAREQLTREANSETVRSNRAQESLQARNLTEQNRSNRANERIRSEANLIASRNQQETRRSNLANESIRRSANAINQQQADTNRLNYYVNLQNANTASYQAETQRLGHYENVRHNSAVETETNRSNLANEQIRRDTNAINLSLGQANVSLRQQEIANNYQLGLGNLAVAQRNAQTNAGNLLEQRRSNINRESISRQQLALDSQVKLYQNQTNRLSVTNQQRQAAAAQAEINRHNRYSELYQRRDTDSQVSRRRVQNVVDAGTLGYKLISLFL